MVLSSATWLQGKSMSCLCHPKTRNLAENVMWLYTALTEKQVFILCIPVHLHYTTACAAPLIGPSVLCLSGIPQPTVTWHRKNGPSDTGAVVLPSGSLWIQNVSLQNQGTYSCTATNTIGKSTASTVLQVYGGFTYKYIYITSTFEIIGHIQHLKKNISGVCTQVRTPPEEAGLFQTHKS